MSALGIPELRSLLAVSAFAGVGRAAEALHLSQPAVTGHVRRLEAEIGAPLIFRQGRTIALTAVGESLVADAYRIIAAHDDALDRARGRIGSDLVVASTNMAGVGTLRTVSRVLAAHAPGQRVSVRFHRTVHLEEFARTRTADVVLGYGRFGADSVPIGRVELDWFTSAVHPRTDALVTFTAPCLVRETLLASPVARGRDLVRESIDLTGLLMAVRAGEGMTALPRSHRHEPGLTPVAGLASPGTLQLSAVFSDRLSREARHELIREMRTAVAVDAA
ncbi:MAG: LysR family transcriptional regulator [Microbacterium sp.]|jgi:DNA-binding transcriptional LysR family regulator|nr:LysR family transcriptional regulator [Microbacterium sp.]